MMVESEFGVSNQEAWIHPYITIQAAAVGVMVLEMFSGLSFGYLIPSLRDLNASACLCSFNNVHPS